MVGEKPSVSAFPISPKTESYLIPLALAIDPIFSKTDCMFWGLLIDELYFVSI